jgi:hypothetical protein
MAPEGDFDYALHRLGQILRSDSLNVGVMRLSSGPTIFSLEEYALATTKLFTFAN